MAYSDEVKRTLRSNYIYKGLPLRAVADGLDIPYETARNWKRKAEAEGDDWDTARSAARISQDGVKALTADIIEDFTLLFKSTIDELKNSDKTKPLQKAEAIARLSDAYQKTVKAAGASNPELSRLAVAMDVIKLFSEFIKRDFPKHFDAFLEVIEPFGEVLSHEFN